MMPQPRLCMGLFVMFGWLATVPALAFTFEFPGPATASAHQPASRASYALPIARWEKSGLLTRRIDGFVERSAWRIDLPKLTSLDLMAPLRAQLLAAGFQPLFECETESCGGFDFRFATEVLPEPDMHVDLGDFRFLSVERQGENGAEAIGLLVSRSATQGFIQVTQATEATPPPLDAPTNDAPATVVPSQTSPLAPAMARLVGDGAVVLEGLDFGTGSADLTEGRYASLAELAAWLTENPDKTIALVGHTDASGPLDANIAVSKRRAASVRARLIEVYGIPSAQIEAQGVGYLSPVASNLTEEGRQKNRRVEAILTSTQ